MANRSAFYQDTRDRWFTRKDPDAVLDYAWDWSDFVADIDDTVSNAVFSASGGLTVTALGLAGGVASARVSGGQVGDDAAVTCRITTAGGQIEDSTVNFLIVEK